MSASCVAWYDIWRARPRSSVTSCSSTTAPTNSFDIIADGRGRQLDRALAAIRPRQQHGAAAEIDRRPAGQRLPHRIGQQPAVRLIDKPDDVLESLADRGRGQAARQTLGRRD